MSKKWTYDEVKNFIEVKSDSGCKLLSESYEDSYGKLNIVCKCGEEFIVSFTRFKNADKRQCNICGINKRKEKRKLDYDHVKKP